MNHHPTGFEKGQLVGVTEFPYNEIDRGNPLAAVVNEEDLPPWEIVLQDRNAKLLLSKFSRVVVRIAQAQNSKMSAECFMIATGDTADNQLSERSIADTAKRHRVSKQAASKCCVEWCEYLGAKPSAYMRSLAAKISFREKNATRKKSFQ